MMHLKYKYIDTDASMDLEKVIISPDNANMSILRAMVDRVDMQIENPARSFVLRYNSDFYEGWEEEDVEREAEIANILSEAWNDNSLGNIFEILAEIMKMYVREKLENGGV